MKDKKPDDSTREQSGPVPGSAGRTVYDVDFTQAGAPNIRVTKPNPKAADLALAQAVVAETGSVVGPPAHDRWPYVLREISVGKLLDPGRTHGPEGMRALMVASGIMFAWWLETPTAGELGELRRRAEIRFVRSKHTIMFLVRAGTLPWSEAPFSFSLHPEPYRSLPPGIGPTARWDVVLVMVDALSGVVRGVRELTLSWRFSQAVRTAFERQLEIPPDINAHMAEIRHFRRKSVGALAADAIDRFIEGEA